MDQLFKRYKATADQKVLLFYQGKLSFNLVQMFIEQIEKSVEKDTFSVSFQKKVFNILVEVFQNLTHHIDHVSGQNQNDDYKTASLKVWIENGKCYVSTGNYIEQNKIPKLNSWLEQINNLDTDGLRKLYLEVLDNNSFSEKGGGGLGFLVIARKANSKIKFDFNEVNDIFSYFNFETTINIENK